MSVRRFEPAIQRLQRAVVHASKPARPPAADPQRLNQGRALDRHPRGRSGRGADGDVGEAGGRVARLGPVAETVPGARRVPPEPTNHPRSGSRSSACASPVALARSVEPPPAEHF